MPMGTVLSVAVTLRSPTPEVPQRGGQQPVRNAWSSGCLRCEALRHGQRFETDCGHSRGDGAFQWNYGSHNIPFDGSILERSGQRTVTRLLREAMQDGRGPTRFARNAGWHVVQAN